MNEISEVVLRAEPVNNCNLIISVTSDRIVGVNPSIKILRSLPSPTFSPGASISKNSSFPKFIRLEFTTLGARVSVVRVLAGTGRIILSVPSNNTVLIVGGFCNLVAVAEFPVNVDPLSVPPNEISENKLVPDRAVTFPVMFPIKSAVTIPAEKSPLESRATTFPILFSGVASTDQVSSNVPSHSEPKK